VRGQPCIGNRSIFEEYINSIIHALGAAGLLIGTICLLTIAENVIQTVSIIIYGTTGVVTLLCSTIFHGTVYNATRRELWHILDQVAIYLMISGTYTPIIMKIEEPLTNISLWLIWGCTLMLAVWKTRFLNVSDAVSIVSYLALGWFGLFAIGPQLENLPSNFTYLLLGGGSVITIGVFFWMNDHRKYFHTIWHILVLLGIGMHYHAISKYIIYS